MGMHVRTYGVYMCTAVCLYVLCVYNILCVCKHVVCLAAELCRYLYNSCMCVSTFMDISMLKFNKCVVF